MYRALLLSMITLLALTGCSDDDAEADEPTAIPEPTATLESEPEPTVAPAPTATVEPVVTPEPTPVEDTAMAEDDYLDLVVRSTDVLLTMATETERIDQELEPDSPEWLSELQGIYGTVIDFAAELGDVEPPEHLEHQHFNLQTGFEKMSGSLSGILDDLEAGQSIVELQSEYQSSLVTAGSFIHAAYDHLDELYDLGLVETTGIRRPQ